MSAGLSFGLPKILRPHRGNFAAALDVAIPGKWPEGERMLEAEQPRAIGEALVRTLHKHLERAQIAYLFREQIEGKLGVAAKCSAKVRFLADRDYTIEFDWKAWKALSPEQRIALVDHELCHCGGRDEKGNWTVQRHDVEEFTAIVGRYGCWRPELQGFVRTASQQAELFPD